MSKKSKKETDAGNKKNLTLILATVAAVLLAAFIITEVNLKSQIRDVTAEKTALEATQTAITAENAQLQETVSGLETANADLTEQVTALDADKTALQETVSGLETANADLTEQVTALDADKTALQETVSGLETANADLTEQVAALDADKTALQETISGLETANADLTGQVAALSDEKDSLASQLKQTLDHSDSAEKTEAIKKTLGGPADNKSESIVIKASAVFADETLAQTFNGSSVSVKADERALNLLLTMSGINLVDLTLDWDEDGIGFYLPMIDTNYYRIDKSLLLSLREENAENSEKAFGANLDIEKYAAIINQYFSMDDFVVTEEPVEIVAFKTTIECKVQTLTPSDEQLRGFLSDLLTEMDNDPQIEIMIFAKALSSKEGAASGSPEAYAQTQVEEFHDIIRQTLDNLEEIVQNLSGMKLTIATRGDRLHEILLDGVYGYSFLYESLGDVESARGDAVFFFNRENESIVLVNVFHHEDDLIVGSCNLAINAEDIVMGEYAFDPAEKSELMIPYGDYAAEITNIGSARLSVYENGSGSMHELNFDSGDATFYIESAPGEAIQKPDLSPVEIHTADELNAVFNNWFSTLSSLF